MKHLVVVGLGYVGLPLVAEAVRAGLSVTGFDITPAVVEGLNAGRSHVDDLSDETIADLLYLGFRATGDVACVEDADAVVICVPTPLSAEGGPDLAAVEGACREIGPQLRPGTLVVLESTTYPGTTAELVRPLLEELSGLGPDQLHVAYSPERIDPGNPQLRAEEHAQGRRRGRPGRGTEGARLLRAGGRRRRGERRHPRGRVRQAVGEHLPAREHRPRERDGSVLPRARHRLLGGHPTRLHQAVRVPAVHAQVPAWAATASPSTPTT